VKTTSSQQARTWRPPVDVHDAAEKEAARLRKLRGDPTISRERILVWLTRKAITLLPIPDGEVLP
jgi:hypothetical protein